MPLLLLVGKKNHSNDYHYGCDTCAAQGDTSNGEALAFQSRRLTSNGSKREVA